MESTNYSETPKDKTYQKITEQLDGFIEHLPSWEDRQLLSKMVSECYFKYSDAIRVMEKDDPSLTMPMIMSLLLDQQSMINRLKDNNNC